MSNGQFIPHTASELKFTGNPAIPPRGVLESLQPGNVFPLFLSWGPIIIREMGNKDRGGSGSDGQLPVSDALQQHTKGAGRQVN